MSQRIVGRSWHRNSSIRSRGLVVDQAPTSTPARSYIQPRRGTLRNPEFMLIGASFKVSTWSLDRCRRRGESPLRRRAAAPALAPLITIILGAPGA